MVIGGQWGGTTLLAGERRKLSSHFEKIIKQALRVDGADSDPVLYRRLPAVDKLQHQKVSYFADAAPAWLYQTFLQCRPALLQQTV
ncbi:hypothetical protein D3C87_1785210 [compost metagenome]